MPKMVFIAHPISDDPEENTRKVLEICRRIHTPDVIPLFPSLAWRMYLSAIDAGDKALAKMAIEEYFSRGVVDELWFYGDKLSNGMLRELELADQYGVQVVAKTPKVYELLMEAVLRSEFRQGFGSEIGYEP